MNETITKNKKLSIETTPGDLAAILHNSTGNNVVYIAELQEDWNTLTNAGIPALYCTQDTTTQLLSMLRGKPTRKTIIIWNNPDTVSQWNEIIKAVKEDTGATVKYLPDDLRETMKQLRKNPYSEHATKWEKAIKEYAENEEEEANPKPGNILEYLTGGKYEKDLLDFQTATNLKTMFPVLDQKLNGGLYAGLYVIGAAPGTGKTTFVLQVADQIAEQHKHILFFSMEQSRLELVTKSISRIARKMYPSKQERLKTSLQIRQGYTSNETEQAMQKYKNDIAPYINIIEGNFNTTADTIRATTEKYINQNAERPVVIIDYLQIVQPEEKNSKKDMRLQIDGALTAFKQISRDLNVPVIVVSSLKRGDYYKPLSMDSFKETGGIEFTADVLIGLEFKEVRNFTKSDTDETRRASINREKEKPARDLLLTVLKNRYGISYFDIEYTYMPAYDFFTELKEYKKVKRITA